MSNNPSDRSNHFELDDALVQAVFKKKTTVYSTTKSNFDRFNHDKSLFQKDIEPLLTENDLADKLTVPVVKNKVKVTNRSTHLQTDRDADRVLMSPDDASTRESGGLLDFYSAYLDDAETNNAANVGTHPESLGSVGAGIGDDGSDQALPLLFPDAAADTENAIRECNTLLFTRHHSGERKIDLPGMQWFENEITTGQSVNQLITNVEYETVPYPLRDPNDDKLQLRMPMLDNLMQVNQHFWQGTKGFPVANDDAFEVLVAGGRSGDSTVYLASQLAENANARIVCFESNKNCVQLIRQRLQNQSKRLGKPQLAQMVTFCDDDFEKMTPERLGAFDYVSCSGVLHHLENAQEGLQRLNLMLKPDGVLGLMVYCRTGRMSINHMQDLMQIINRDVSDVRQKVTNAKRILENLPKTNLHNKGGWVKSSQQNSVEVYESYIHAEQHLFGVSQLESWLASAGMTFGRFTSHYQVLFNPNFFPFKLSHAIRQRLLKMSPLECAAFAELYFGHINTLEFYATRTPLKSLDLTQKEVVPAFSAMAKIQELPNIFANVTTTMTQKPTYHLQIDDYKFTITVPYDVVTATFLSLIDGKRNMGEICSELNKQFQQVTPEEIHNYCLVHLRQFVETGMLEFC